MSRRGEHVNRNCLFQYVGTSRKVPARRSDAGCRVFSPDDGLFRILSCQRVVGSRTQDCKVPAQRLRPAGNIHNLSRAKLQQCLQEVLRCPRPRRIHEYNIRTAAALRHLGHKFSGIRIDVFELVLCVLRFRLILLQGSVLLSIIHPGICLCVLHRLRIDLDTDDLLRTVRRTDTDGSDAAVRVKNRFSAGEPRHINCDVVEFFCLNRIDLVEGAR